MFVVYPHDTYSTDAPVAAFTTREGAEAWIKRQEELRAQERVLLHAGVDDATLDAWFDAHEGYVDSPCWGIVAVDVDPALP